MAFCRSGRSQNKPKRHRYQIQSHADLFSSHGVNSTLEVREATVAAGAEHQAEIGFVPGFQLLTAFRLAGGNLPVAQKSMLYAWSEHVASRQAEHGDQVDIRHVLCND